MSLFLNLLFEQDSYSNAYLLATFGFDTAEAAHATARTPRAPPAPTQRGVVSRVCPSSRTGAVGIAELVAVHIVLVKLSFAIKPSAVTCQMLL